MTTFAISMVKDEADVVAHTIGHMVDQVDAVLVYDNGSIDGTREILSGLDRVQVLDDPDPAYYQSRKMSRLATIAAREGAEWVVPFDADEIWLTTSGRPIAAELADIGEGVAVCAAPIFNYVATADDDPELGPLQRLRWRRRDPLPLPKVACRPALPVTIEQGNHGARWPTEIAHGLLEVHHFPYRSPDQFLSKVRNGAAAYKATDLPPDVGQHWREYGELLERGGEEAVRGWFNDHFLVADPAADPDLIAAPCPLLS